MPIPIETKPGWSDPFRQSAVSVSGDLADLTFAILNAGPTIKRESPNPVLTIPDEARPKKPIYGTFSAERSTGTFRIDPDGTVTLTDLMPGEQIRPGEMIRGHTFYLTN